MSKNYRIIDNQRRLPPFIGDKLTCPVCQEEFTVTEDTNYYVKGGPVCNWKCFKQRLKDTEEDRKIKKGLNR